MVIDLNKYTELKDFLNKNFNNNKALSLKEILIDIETNYNLFELEKIKNQIDILEYYMSKSNLEKFIQENAQFTRFYKYIEQKLFFKITPYKNLYFLKFIKKYIGKLITTKNEIDLTNKCSKAL